MCVCVGGGGGLLSMCVLLFDSKYSVRLLENFQIMPANLKTLSSFEICNIQPSYNNITKWM